MPEKNPFLSMVGYTEPASSLDPDTDARVQKYSAENGVDPDLVRRMVHQESTGSPTAVSPKGARGLMQLMPDTAKRFGVSDPFDPDQNLSGGTKYLRFLLDRYKGDVNLALAGYNAGEGAVDKHGGRVPPYRETQDYVKRIGGGYRGTGYQGNTPPPAKPEDLSNSNNPFIKMVTGDVRTSGR